MFREYFMVCGNIQEDTIRRQPQFFGTAGESLLVNDAFAVSHSGKCLVVFIRPCHPVPPLNGGVSRYAHHFGATRSGRVLPLHPAIGAHLHRCLVAP